jgi:hypothetical protein
VGGIGQHRLNKNVKHSRLDVKLREVGLAAPGQQRMHSFATGSCQGVMHAYFHVGYGSADCCACAGCLLLPPAGAFHPNCDLQAVTDKLLQRQQQGSHGYQ